jgi:hypothetical protein
MNPEKGVYMIAYSDSQNAKKLKNRLNNNQKNRKWFERELENVLSIPKYSLKLEKIKSFYWDIGTHYYLPLDRRSHKNRNLFINDARHPEKNILVTGEMVSLNQGWVEGALESVEETIEQFINY